MASIRKRTWKSGGEEKTAWIADYFHRGKRHIKTFSTQKAAKAWLVTAQGEVARGVHTPENASITVAEAAELWLQTGELDELERGTLRQYRYHIDLHINPLIGHEKLARLSSPTIESYRDALLSKCSRSMARKVLASLKSIVSEAQRRGLVAHNAASPVKVRTDKRENKLEIPSKPEIQTILSSATGRRGPLFVTAIFTGMRSSELRGLTWDSVDFERRVIHVRQRADLWGTIGAPKSAAGNREIPMSPMVVNVLREWRLACPKGPLNLAFPNSVGKVEAHANIANRGFYPLQIEAGIVDGDGKAKYGFHALRHFCASWLIDQGFSPKRVQVWMGHSSIQMTFDVYGHLFLNLEEDHAKLAAGELKLIG